MRAEGCLKLKASFPFAAMGLTPFD